MPKKVCSFCGRSENEVNLLITGINGFICENCARQAYEIVQSSGMSDIGERKGNAPFKMKKIPKPLEIKKHLDQYVIGQEDAKRYLSVSVYNHYKRLQQPADNDGVEIEKSNIIMVGSTGTGKTLLARTIARLLEVPFSIVDATVFTEAGYVGEDVESILSRLLQAADYNVEAAERGIVFIDEIDKIALKTLGNIVMDDETHIGFVDSHAESNGGHNHIDALHEESVLRGTSCSAVESGMVRSRLDFVGTKHGGQFFHFLPAQTIDDATLARILPDELDYLLVDVFGFGTNFII